EHHGFEQAAGPIVDLSDGVLFHVTSVPLIDRNGNRSFRSAVSGRLQKKRTAVNVSAFLFQLKNLVRS
ncbi:hypothetical protein, partial [Faecalibaculum rodentium]|uniref:hypothetical protein n=1 Tax=Faecalibaculum rodentium TaxID=1702221 RepID=UPI0025A9BD38